MSKKLFMITNIRIKRVSRSAQCLTVKLFVDKITDKDELEIIVNQFLID